MFASVLAFVLVLQAIVALRELIPDSRGNAPLLRLQRRLTRQTDAQAQLYDASCIAHESSPAIKFLRLCNATLLRGIALERIFSMQRAVAPARGGPTEDKFDRSAALVRRINGGNSQLDGTEKKSTDLPSWLGLFWNVVVAPCLVFVEQELAESFLKLDDQAQAGAAAGAPTTRRQELRAVLSRHRKVLFDAFRGGCVPRGWSEWLRARSSQDELLASAVDEFVEVRVAPPPRPPAHTPTFTCDVTPCAVPVPTNQPTRERDWPLSVCRRVCLCACGVSRSCRRKSGRIIPVLRSATMMMTTTMTIMTTTRPARRLFIPAVSLLLGIGRRHAGCPLRRCGRLPRHPCSSLRGRFASCTRGPSRHRRFLPLHSATRCRFVRLAFLPSVLPSVLPPFLPALP